MRIRKFVGRIYLNASKAVVKSLRRFGFLPQVGIKTDMGCRYLAAVCFVNRLLPVDIAGMSFQDLRSKLLDIDAKLKIEQNQLLYIRDRFLERKGLAGYVR